MSRATFGAFTTDQNRQALHRIAASVAPQGQANRLSSIFQSLTGVNGKAIAEKAVKGGGRGNNSNNGNGNSSRSGGGGGSSGGGGGNRAEKASRGGGGSSGGGGLGGGKGKSVKAAATGNRSASLKDKSKKRVEDSRSRMVEDRRGVTPSEGGAEGKKKKGKGFLPKKERAAKAPVSAMDLDTQLEAYKQTQSEAAAAAAAPSE